MKMKKFAMAAMAAILAVTGTAYGYQDGDFQIWHTEVQEAGLKQSTKIIAEEEFRYGDRASELYYHHYDIGLAYDFSKNLTTSINYRQIYEGEKGKFKPEFRPRIDVIPKFELYGFAIEDRNRLELRLYDDNREDAMQYRNKLSVKAPWKFTRFNIRPYVADEVFVNMNSLTWRRNRFSTGVTFDAVKHLKGEVYYMLQDTKKSGRWTSADILGLKVKVVF